MTRLALAVPSSEVVASPDAAVAVVVWLSAGLFRTVAVEHSTAVGRPAVGAVSPSIAVGTASAAPVGESAVAVGVTGSIEHRAVPAVAGVAVSVAAGAVVPGAVVPGAVGPEAVGPGAVAAVSVAVPAAVAEVDVAVAPVAVVARCLGLSYVSQTAGDCGL